MALGDYLGAGAAVTKGLWHFNGNSDDSSGNGNDGTDFNMAYAAGEAIFNGTSSYINCGSAFDFSGNNPFTVVVKYNVDAAASLRGIVGQWNAGGNQIRRLYFNSTTIAFARNGAVRSLLGGGVVVGEEQILVATYDGTSTSIFLNGALGDTDTDTSSIGAYTEDLIIGARVSAGSPANFLDGKLPEVVIENRAWNAVEIQKHYTYAKGRYAIL